MLHALAGFHHQVAHRVTNHLPQHDQHGWYLGISPPCQTGQFFHHEGIHPRTIADYIASCLIFNLCTQAQPPFTLQLPASDNEENTPSASPMQSCLYRWWTQLSSSESAPPSLLMQASLGNPAPAPTPDNTWPANDTTPLELGPCANTKLHPCPCADQKSHLCPPVGSYLSSNSSDSSPRYAMINCACVYMPNLNCALLLPSRTR